jgi:hypothetical protein
LALIREYPAILQSLYLSAITRDEETREVIGNVATNVIAEDYDLV